MCFPFLKVVDAAIPASVIAFIILFSCVRTKDNFSIILPPTYPLSRPVIGYGVIVPSYINLSSAPDPESFSQGYMRRGTIVNVIERKAVQKQSAIESWVFIEGGYKGWLNEAYVYIYDYKAQAVTASDVMSQ
ncbi:MAG: SH3 domain-containing protein [Treponema sp.]|nr:SH3 domain-containing protein [Treponema sp.]